MTPIECQKDVIKTQYPLVTVEIANMPATTSVTLNTGVIMPTVGLGKSDPCIRDAGLILLFQQAPGNPGRPSCTHSGFCVEEWISTYRHCCQLSE